MNRQDARACSGIAWPRFLHLADLAHPRYPTNRTVRGGSPSKADEKFTLATPRQRPSALARLLLTATGIGNIISRAPATTMLGFLE